MKIAIYSICKNEEPFARRFAESVKDADLVIVCDTGSTDKTKEILKEYPNIEVYDIEVNPFRFDVARNHSLDMIPEGFDVAIALDLDDVLVKGWRQSVESMWKEDTTVINYKYIYDWGDKEHTVPRLSIWGFKIHAPAKYRWVYPIHEVLKINDGLKENAVFTKDCLIEHHPDWSRINRRPRISIFEDALAEYKDDARMTHLYGRELFFCNRFKEAIVYLKKYLQMTKSYPDEEVVAEGFPQTRSTTCRLIAKCLIGLRGDMNEIIIWFIRSVAESPSQREPWMWLAYAWMRVDDGAAAYAAARRGLMIENQEISIELEQECWGEDAEELTRSAYTMMLDAPDLYRNNIDGWMATHELLFLKDKAKKMDSVVEIGCWKGRSTHALLSECQGQVYAVDTFEGSPGEKAHEGINPKEIYHEFLRNVGAYTNLKLLKMDSVEASKEFKDGSIDMVFIDGAHTKEAVTADITAWLPKAKKLICGHDYNWPEVKAVVDTLIKDVKVTGVMWYKYI